MNPLTDDRIDHPGGDRVRAALRGAAASLQLEAPGPDAARAAAHHRGRRQQRMTAGIASLAVVAGGVGVASLVAREPGVELDSPAVGSTSGTTFTWVDAEHMQASHPQIVQAPDGVLYALSTAPGVTWDDAGEGPLPQAVYRSADGLSWEATELDPDLQLAGLDVSPDGVLYAISTAPDTPSLRVATSADGGASWQLDDLPASAPAPAVAEGVTLAIGGEAVDVATGAEGSVATVYQQWYVLVEGLVPPEEEERSWLVPTDAGLEVHVDRSDPERPSEGPAPAAVPITSATSSEGEAAAGAVPAPVAASDEFREPDVEVVRTIPWAEVGLTGPQDLRRTQAYAAGEGGDWVEVDLPLPSASAAVEATSEGFVAVLHQSSDEVDTATPIHVARSADGVIWTLDEAPLAEATWVSEVGSIGDRLVVTASRIVNGPEYEETVVVASSGDVGRTWTTVDLNGVLPVDASAGQSQFFGSGDVGALGIVATSTVFDDQTGENQATTLLYSPDGVAWDVIPATDLGADVDAIGWVSIDTDRITASVYTDEHDGRTVVGTPTR